MRTTIINVIIRKAAATGAVVRNVYICPGCVEAIYKIVYKIAWRIGRTILITRNLIVGNTGVRGRIVRLRKDLLRTENNRKEKENIIEPEHTFIESACKAICYLGEVSTHLCIREAQPLTLPILCVGPQTG